VVLCCILLAWVLIAWAIGGPGRADVVYSTAYVLLYTGITAAILLGVSVVRRDLESRQRIRDYYMRMGSAS